MLHDLHMADDTTAQMVFDATTTSPCTLFQRFLLDMSAVYHAVPYREWFSTYSAVRHGCADTDTLSSDVAGVGDIHLVFADGASMVLHDVRHMPTMTKCLVSTAQQFCETMVMLLCIQSFLESYIGLRL